MIMMSMKLATDFVQSVQNPCQYFASNLLEFASPFPEFASHSFLPYSRVGQLQVAHPPYSKQPKMVSKVSF